MSTHMITYLSYMSGWAGASDQDIQTMIEEHNLFVSLSDFTSDEAVNKEFNTLVDLATAVRDGTLAADAQQMAADAAAVASIWSFGLGMAAFVALETTALITRAVVSSKSKDLNEKLKTVDTDIATFVGPSVSKYITDFKLNNNLIAAKAAKGMDAQTCRAILLQFMAQIEAKGGKLDVITFRQYAESARMLFESKEIEAVYDALDKLNMSAKSEDDVKQFIDSITGFTGVNKTALTIVRFVSISVVGWRLKVARERLAKENELAELLEFEKGTSVWKMMDGFGKFAAGVMVVASVVDVVLNIIDIVDVVKQTKKMVDELNGKIKTDYKAFFNGIKEAAQHYNEAIKKKTG